MHRAITVLAAACLAAAGCSGGGSGTAATTRSGCAAPVQEQLDSRSTQHLFPGAAEPRYLTDPPTSGPHQLGPPVTGVSSTPIPRPRQVAMLESGYVLIQRRGLSPAASSQLDALAANLVTVAPPVATMPAPIVVTAWDWKLVCGTVDTGAIQAFITAHKGKGFSH